MNNFNKFLNDNILWLLIVIVVAGAGLYFAITNSISVFESFGEQQEKEQILQNKKAELEKRKTEIAREKKAEEEAQNEQKDKKSGSGKVIYEVLGQQFSPEASFGIMFENVLSNITNSGVRIRSIDYNYTLQDDPILGANAPGYNACELSFTTVATYSQLQNFFKNIVKENYLTNIYEVYIEPYDKDKTILIAKFKVRLYTKTIEG